MDFKDLVQLRRSHRKFTDEEIDADDVKMILRAGLMAPTSKGQRAWQFVVVDDKMDLEKLSDANGFRCVVVDFLMGLVQIPLFKEFWIFQRICLVFAFLPLVIRLMSASPRTKIS